jgi:hypothetical protein
MTDKINDALGADNDDQEPTARTFLSLDEIEERVAIFHASLLMLDKDPAEAARIDELIAGANAMFGDDLTPFEDPPVAGPIRGNVQQVRQVVINGSHAQPRIEVDYAGQNSPSPEFSLIINGDHAGPRVHVGANQLDQEVGQLSEEIEELQQAVASLRADAQDQPTRKAPRMREPSPSVLAAALGLSSAAIATHAIAGAQIIVAIMLAAVPVLWLTTVTVAIFASARTARREGAALSVLRLLLNRSDLHLEDPPGAGRSGRHQAISRRD